MATAYHPRPDQISTDFHNNAVNGNDVTTSKESIGSPPAFPGGKGARAVSTPGMVMVAQSPIFVPSSHQIVTPQMSPAMVPYLEDPNDKTPAEYSPTAYKQDKYQLRYERWQLRKSLESMDVESCPKETMIDCIKLCQRLDIEMRTSWIHYTNAEAKGIRDPNKHDAEFLRVFFRGLQDGTMDYYRRMKNPHRGENANEVFVGGIGVIAHDRITDYFKEFGDLRYVDIKKDKGFGFVKFDDKDAMAKVLDKPEHIIEGKRVEVKPAENRTPKPKKDISSASRFSGLMQQQSAPAAYGYSDPSGAYGNRFSVATADGRLSTMSAPSHPVYMQPIQQYGMAAQPQYGMAAQPQPMMMAAPPGQPMMQYAWVPVQVPANQQYPMAYQTQ